MFVFLSLQLVRLQAHSRGLELKIQISAGVPEGVFGDVLRLRQIILNLLSNAIKFTKSGAIYIR
jgi:signal transduction histidine kinase